MRHRLIIFSSLAFCVFAGSVFEAGLFAQETERAVRKGEGLPAVPTYVCRRTKGGIEVDGKLSEEDWQRAAEVSLLENSGKGGPLQPKTVARMLWDDEYLYVAFVAEDTDIYATMRKRDDHLWTGEVVEVFVGRTDIYVEIEVNPLNTLFDAPIDIRGQTGTPKFDVDSLAKVDFEIKHAVLVEGTVHDRSDKDRRWTVELALPHSALEGIQRVPPKGDDAWRINLYRIEKSLEGGKIKEAAGAWSPTAGWFHTPSRFGKIVFRAEK